MAIPVLGKRVVGHPRFVPWFLRLGGQAALFADEHAALYADQFRDPARAAAASRLYRNYLQTARVVLLRRAFADQRLEAPTRLLFGADDFNIPLAVLEGLEPTATISPSRSSGAAVTGCRRNAPTSSPTAPGPCSADDVCCAWTARR